MQRIAYAAQAVKKVRPIRGGDHFARVKNGTTESDMLILALELGDSSAGRLRSMDFLFGVKSVRHAKAASLLFDIR